MSDMRWYRNQEIDDLRKRQRDLERRMNSAVENRNYYRNTLNDIYKEINSASTMSTKRVVELINQMNDATESRIEAFSEEMQIAMGKQNIEFHNNLAQVYRNLDNIHGRINDVYDQIDNLSNSFRETIASLNDREEARLERAETARIQLGFLLGNINMLHPDKLTPGEAEIVSQILADVNTDIQNEDAEAAISLVQGKMPEAVNLYARLEIMNREYDELLVWLNDRIKLLNGRFEELIVPEKNRCAIEDKRLKIEFDGDVNFWSSNVLSELMGQYNELVGQILDTYFIEYDLENLRNACIRIERIEQDIQLCVNLSYQEFIEYAYLCDVARLINNNMNGYGWDKERNGFSDDDKRKPYYLIYDDHAGNTATIVINQSREYARKKERKDGKDLFIPVLAEYPIFGVDVENEDTDKANATRRGIINRLVSNTDIKKESILDYAESLVSGKPSEQFREETANTGDKKRLERVNNVRTQIDFMNI